MGGSYLTLLNTISNLGSAWPKFFVFILIDWLTLQRCIGLPEDRPSGEALSCPLKLGMDIKNGCVEVGGSCVKRIDGFYPLSICLIVLGLLVGHYFRKCLREFENARDDAWRAS